MGKSESVFDYGPTESYEIQHVVSHRRNRLYSLEQLLLVEPDAGITLEKEKQTIHWMREAVHTLIGHDKDHAYLIEHSIRSTKKLEKSLLQNLQACQEQIRQCFAYNAAEFEAFEQDRAKESDLEQKLSELAYKVE